LIRQLGLQPVSEGGTEGYRIGEQAPKQLIEQVGLNQGDVVVSVNGYPLGDEESDLAALQSYLDSQAASIVVQRGEQEFTVNYPP
jgi:general secretion pathway protein C